MVKIDRPREIDKARVISVIETKALRGTGTEEDPCRIVTQYWDFNGNKLAENDTEDSEDGTTYEEKESKKRTINIRVDMNGIRKTKEEVEQLIKLLREANNQAAPL